MGTDHEVNTYAVRTWFHEGWWVVEIPEIDGYTQAQTFEDVAGQARDYVVLALELPNVAEVAVDVRRVAGPAWDDRTQNPESTDSVSRIVRPRPSSIPYDGQSSASGQSAVGPSFLHSADERLASPLASSLVSPYKHTGGQMRGIATVDRQPESHSWALWITSASSGDVARHVNAVTIDANDPVALEKIRSLTRCTVVLGTDGTTTEGLPIEGKPLIPADIDGLLDEVAEHQEKILTAIRHYRATSKSRTLTEPAFSPRPVPKLPPEDTAKDRAFALANYVSAAWTAWLSAEAERIRRTVQPKTGTTPWIMPADMSGLAVAPFPPRFTAGLVEQAII